MTVMKTLVVIILMLATCAFSQNPSSRSVAEVTQQAEVGSIEAQLQLGLAYEEGRGVPQSDELALKWYRKAAEQGSAKAQNKVGVMYALGHGAVQDQTEAFRWYKKAALQGLAAADYNVAISYFNGDGTSLDPARAYAWMMLAQRNGDPKAAEALSRMSQEVTIRTHVSERILTELFEGGNEVPRDWKSALDLYLKLTNENLRAAVNDRGSVYLKICLIVAADKPGLPHDYSAAKMWCRKAAQNEQPTGDVILGRMAEQGLGGPPDLKEAEHRFHSAAIHGSADGFMELGRLKLQSGSHQDEVEAYYWFYLGKLFKIEGAEVQAKVAAQHLSEDEIRSQQKKAERRLSLNNS